MVGEAGGEAEANGEKKKKPQRIAGYNPAGFGFVNPAVRKWANLNLTDRFNTDLTPEQRKNFNRWCANTSFYGKVKPTTFKRDYDITGWWLAHGGRAGRVDYKSDDYDYVLEDPATMPPEWAKPNHPNWSYEKSLWTMGLPSEVKTDERRDLMGVKSSGVAGEQP
jgi:hypothetical protein